MLQLIIEALSLVIFTVLGLLSRLLLPFKRLLVCYRTLASFLPREAPRITNLPAPTPSTLRAGL